MLVSAKIPNPSCDAFERVDSLTDEGLSVETASFESAVGIGDPIEQDALGDARADPSLDQHRKQPLQILLEPVGMSGAQLVDRVEARACRSAASSIQ
jgi:hypothetical protein